MIVITGGAGFIGSALVWELNKRGEDNILIVDNLGSSEKWKNLVGLNFTDFVHKDDFLDLLLEDELEIQAIFHLGACSSTTELDANYLMDNNYEYSKTLAIYCHQNNIRFIYASSAATYGDGNLGYSDSLQLNKLKPLNMYGYSKHIFDQWMQKHQLDCHAIGLKFFNVWGPNENHKGSMKSMVAKAYDQIKTVGHVSLFKSHHKDYKDGMQKRDFVYVKDVVKMILHFYDKKELNGIFNIGSSKAHTWLDLVEPIFDALQIEKDIIFIDMPQELRGKYQYFTQADMSKYLESGLKEIITPLNEAVKDYVLDYLVKDKYLN
ncbi:MAG: ADP-glyceromanno-heptose 6-epimerase [Candidatus Cloacimonadota bacterium]|nr:MAG: ADP-glyceromanno-heptose 6-epimerase [Candidatus Cloacimonadota bacterium]